MALFAFKFMDEITRFTLRIPNELNDWLEQQAQKHNRSKHQETVNILTLAMHRHEAMGNGFQDNRWAAMKDGER